MRKNIPAICIFVLLIIVPLIYTQEETENDSSENFFTKIADFFRNLFVLDLDNKNETTIDENEIIENEEQQNEQQVTEEMIPVLKNLGIILDTPNTQTKRAGDLLFDKKVVWEDGGQYSDKAFGEFGEMGKRKDIINLPGVEYNYAVPIGTKVYAAGDGIAHIFYIEHTEDWGVNIQPEKNSQWKCVRPGNASGKLLGGNLSCLLKLAGTPYLPDFDDALLLIEGYRLEIDEAQCKLTQLKHMGVFEQIAGVVVGFMYSFQQDPRYQIQFEDIVQQLTVHSNNRVEQMGHLIGWYKENTHKGSVGFFQIGGGIAGDFPICVVPLITQDLKQNCKLWGYFCQISDSTTSYGSYSGAVPNEKITWGKLDVTTPRFIIESDATIVAPLIFAYVLGK